MAGSCLRSGSWDRKLLPTQQSSKCYIVIKDHLSTLPEGNSTTILQRSNKESVWNGTSKLPWLVIKAIRKLQQFNSNRMMNVLDSSGIKMWIIPQSNELRLTEILAEVGENKEVCSHQVFSLGP